VAVIQGVTLRIRDAVGTEGQTTEEKKHKITVTIDGEPYSFDGDSFALEIKGNAEDVRVNQGTVTVDGNCMGNVTTKQGNVAIQGDCQGDATSNMGSVHVHGDVGGSAKTQMGSVHVQGRSARRYQR